MKKLLLVGLLIIFSGHKPAPAIEKAKRLELNILSDTTYNYAIETLKKWEVYKATRYELFGDTCIGYGHLLYDTDTNYSLTSEQADSLLRVDYNKALRYVNRIHPRLSARKRHVLAMFAFNCGIGTLSRSELSKSIRANETDSNIESVYMRFIYAGGMPLPQLKKRRIDEFKIWRTKK